MFGRFDVHLRALTYVTYIVVGFAILYGLFYVAVVNDAVNLFISGFFITVLLSVSYMMIYLIADMSVTDEEIKKKYGKDALTSNRQFDYKTYNAANLYTHETHTITVTTPTANT